MRFATLTEIQIPERQRRTPMKEDGLADLAESIATQGLLHAPVVYFTEDRTAVLVAGGRRLTAIRQLYSADPPRAIVHDGFAVPMGKVPVVVLDNPTPLRIAAAELEENMLREDLSWVDEDRALAQIHELKAAENPQQSITDTANQLFTKGVSATVAKSASALAQRLSRARIVAQHLDDPEISGSRNSTEAYRRVLQRREQEAAALLRKAAAAEGAAGRGPQCDLRLGDCLEILPKIPAESFDLILTDPPYGIGAHGVGYRARGEHKHTYDDTLSSARKFLPDLLLECFRVAKARANLFLFTDIQHWDLLQDAAAQIGWVPWRTPLIWDKTQNEGAQPWNAQGFMRTYEVIFFATKGQRGLYYAIPDILRARRVNRSRKVFAAQKPHDLLRQMISAATLEGDLVLDPCAGSGSTLRTSRLLHRHSTGIELNEETFNAALNFIHADREDDELSEPEVKLEDV